VDKADDNRKVFSSVAAMEWEQRSLPSRDTGLSPFAAQSASAPFSGTLLSHQNFNNLMGGKCMEGLLPAYPGGLAAKPGVFTQGFSASLLQDSLSVSVLQAASQNTPLVSATQALLLKGNCSPQSQSARVSSAPVPRKDVWVAALGVKKIGSQDLERLE
jgi:hypothetical protein